MEYELIDVGPCRKRLHFTFTAKDIDAAFAESYQEINNQVQLRGFRKGRAPLSTLEKRFGDEAAAGVRRLLIDQNLGKSVQEKKLHVLGNIVDKTPSAKPARGSDFVIEVELDVAPDFELPEYKGLELTARPVEVAEGAVDEALERYRRIFANYEPVDGPAEPGDVLMVDFAVKVGEDTVASMADQRLRVEGETLFDLPCPDLVTKFTGAKAGDAVTVNVTMPADHPVENLRGREAVVEIAVKRVERGELPTLDDAFASGLGMKSIADFRARIKNNLVREALIEAVTRQEEEIIDMLLAAVTYEAPAEMINAEADALVEQRKMHLSRTNASEADRARQVEEYRPEAAKQALRKVRWGIMANKIAEKEEISVTQEDMATHIEALARSYRIPAAKMIQRIREMDGTEAMMATIISMKVVKFITDCAKNAVAFPEDNAGASESANADSAASVAAAE